MTQRGWATGEETYEFGWAMGDTWGWVTMQQSLMPVRGEVSEFAAIRNTNLVVGQGTEQLWLGSKVGSDEGRFVRIVGWK